MNLCKVCFAVTLLTLQAPNVITAQGKNTQGNGPAPTASTGNPSSAQGNSSTIESQMLALGALDHIASSVASKVCSSKVIVDDASVIIYDQPSFASLQSYEAFVANAKIVSAGYQTLIPPEILRSELKKLAESHQSEHEAGARGKPEKSQRELDQHLSALWKENVMSLQLSTSIDPFSDATSLLSAIAIGSNSENASSLSIPDSVMAVAVTREMQRSPSCKDKGLAIVYPPLFGKASSSDFSAADIQVEIQKLDDVRKVTHAYVDDQKKTGLTNDLKEIDGLYDNFVNSLLQVNSATGVLGSSAVIQGYRLATLLAGREKTATSPAIAPAYVLLGSIVAAGGTQHVHKNIWTALWTGDKITYSGGVAVEIGVWKANSKAPVYADVLRFRAPFRNVKDPSDLSGLDSGDNLPVAQQEKP